MMPSWDITRKLFLIPRALNPSPANGLIENSPVGIEKYPNMPNNSNMTPIGPISGLLKMAENAPRTSRLSDSCLALLAIILSSPKKWMGSVQLPIRYCIFIIYQCLQEQLLTMHLTCLQSQDLMGCSHQEAGQHHCCKGALQ